MSDSITNFFHGARGGKANRFRGCPLRSRWSACTPRPSQWGANGWVLVAFRCKTHVTSVSKNLDKCLTVWHRAWRQGQSVPWLPLALPLGGLHAQAVTMGCQWMGASRLSMQNSCDIRIKNFEQMSNSIAPGVESSSIDPLPRSTVPRSLADSSLLLPPPPLP